MDPKFGIDISKHQGDFNFSEALKDGIEFAIIKCGGSDEGLYRDPQFENNYKKAKELNIPIGTYWYSIATSEEEAKAEALFVYNNLVKNKIFELPIYLDLEPSNLNKNLSRRKMTDIILTWYSTLKNKSLWIGIYSMISFFEERVYDNELENITHWVCQLGLKCDYKKSCLGMWQYKGDQNMDMPFPRPSRIAGKAVDQNYLFIDC